MNILLKVQIAEELEVETDTLTSNTVLKNLEYWDSVMALTVMAMIDTALGTPLSPEEFTKIKTFGDLEALVDKTAAMKG